MLFVGSLLGSTAGLVWTEGMRSRSSTSCRRNLRTGAICLASKTVAAASGTVFWKKARFRTRMLRSTGGRNMSPPSWSIEAGTLIVDCMSSCLLRYANFCAGFLLLGAKPYLGAGIAHRSSEPWVILPRLVPMNIFTCRASWTGEDLLLAAWRQEFPDSEKLLSQLFGAEIRTIL
jgi:hypothetical protein